MEGLDGGRSWLNILKTADWCIVCMTKLCLLFTWPGCGSLLCVVANVGVSSPFGNLDLLKF